MNMTFDMKFYAEELGPLLIVNVSMNWIVLNAGRHPQTGFVLGASPFPPVYRARRDGEISLRGKRFPFRKGQELVWACLMTRDQFELDYPIPISDFDSACVQRTCGEMAQAMMGRMNTVMEE